MFVPVVDRMQHPLMPTTPARARRWIKSGKATAFWKGGLFCVPLNAEPSARKIQPVAVGIDPGSKREGYSVVSAAHTYLNMQAEARQGVKEAEQESTRMRRSRKTPCRKVRQNHKQSKKKLPPSTRARWQWKLRLARFLSQLFPVSIFVVEDIKARTQGKRRWDQGQTKAIKNARARTTWMHEIESGTPTIRNISFIFRHAHNHPFCSASRAASMRFWAPSFCMAVER